MFKKRMLISVIILLLILQSFSFFPNGELTAQAQGIPKKKILAIKDTISSADYLDKTNFKSSGKYEITYMHMKQFVALREELDGKYDIISIGPGDYSTTQVGKKTGNSSAHKTDQIMNDITPTKADEIINAFIKKGQVVLLHKNIFEQTPDLRQPPGVLKAKFDPYKSGYRNVFVVEKPTRRITQDTQYNTTFTEIENYFITHSNVLRPRIDERSFKKPIDYAENPVYVYARGDKLTFEFLIANYEQVKNRKLTSNLYIDANFNKQFEKDELFVSKTLNEVGTRLEYELPMGFSGLRYWKLEVVDDNGLKDYITGVIRFRDQKVEVNVLQITPTGANDHSSLPKVVKNTFFSDEDYKINITVKSANEFNKNTAFSEEDKTIYRKQDYLDGKYNMLLFGFRDSYGSQVPLESGTHAGKEILDKFLATKQSVMFTHDMIFSSSPSWLSYRSAFGQGGDETDLGFGAPIPSQKTMRINDGLLNAFPFNLKAIEDTFNIVNKRSVSGIKIATTHNQYFTVDLNDQEIIPWYNIIDNGSGDNYRNADPYDSYNHFYTYSKGNITYSGTGHTSSGFPESEQKLFVNTMFMAFLGANHAPLIEMFTPSDEQPGEHILTIPSNQKLYVSYQVNDLDLTDYTLYTRIYLDGEQVYPATNGAKEKIRNHSVVSQSFEHGKTEGYVAVKVEVEDEKGAKAETTRYVKIVKAESGLKLNRDIAETAKKATYTLGQKIPIEYSVEGDTTAQALQGATGVTPLFILDNELSSGSLDITKQPFPDKPQIYRTFNPDCTPNTNCNHGSLKDYIANGYTKRELNIGDTFDNKTGNYIEDFVHAINKRSPLVVPIIDYNKFKNNNQIVITKFVTLSADNCSQSKCEVTIDSYPNLNLTNVQFEETFPVGIEIKVDDITGLLEPKVEQLADGGYKVTGKLNNFLFTEKDGKFTAPAQKFTLNITPKKMPSSGTVYQLAPEKSSLKFKNAQNQDKQENFNHLSIPVELGNFTLEAPTKVAVNQPFNIKVDFPADAPTGSKLIWDSLTNVEGTLPVINEPKQANDYTYQLKGTSPGTITIKAKLDVPGVEEANWPTQSAIVTVVNLSLTVDCNKTELFLGNTATCVATLTGDGLDLSGASYNWAGLGDNLQFANGTSATSNPVEVKGIKSGSANLSVTASVEGFTTSTTQSIEVKAADIRISPSSTVLRLNETQGFVVSVDPAGTFGYDFKLRDEGGNIVANNNEFITVSKSGNRLIVKANKNATKKYTLEVTLTEYDGNTVGGTLSTAEAEISIKPRTGGNDY